MTDKAYLRRDIFTELSIAISGQGKYSLNCSIRKIYNDLINRYNMEHDEILDECYAQYKKGAWIYTHDPTKSSLSYYITIKVYYTMLDIRKRQDIIHSKQDVVRTKSRNGLVEELAIENYTDGISTEDEYISKEIYSKLCEELGSMVIKGLLEGKNLKIISEDNSLNYETLRKKYQRTKKKFNR